MQVNNSRRWYYLFYRGLARFDRLPEHKLLGAVTVISVGLMIGYWTYGAPDLYARIVVNTASQIVMFSLLAWALLRRGAPEHPSLRRILGILFSGLVILGLVRITDALSVSGPGDATMLPATPLFAVWVLSLAAVGTLVSIEFLLLPGQRRQIELAELLRRDFMTGALNRQTFDADLASRSRGSSAGPGSMLMVDIDHFKSINDEYGHRAGDMVLRQLASLIAAQLRKQDLFSRYGGEEFVIFLPETTEKEALAIAERIRRTVEDMEVPFGDIPLKVTVSIGVASVGGSASYEDALGIADQAMYVSKGLGRNRVETINSARVTRKPF